MSDEITSDDIAQLEALLDTVNHGLLKGKKSFYFLQNEFTDMLPKIYGEVGWEVTVHGAFTGLRYDFKSTLRPWTEHLIVNGTSHRPT